MTEHKERRQLQLFFNPVKSLIVCLTWTSSQPTWLPHRNRYRCLVIENILHSQETHSMLYCLAKENILVKLLEAPKKWSAVDKWDVGGVITEPFPTQPCLEAIALQINNVNNVTHTKDCCASRRHVHLTDRQRVFNITTVQEHSGILSGWTMLEVWTSCTGVKPTGRCH